MRIPPSILARADAIIETRRATANLPESTKVLVARPDPWHCSESKG